MLKNSIFLSLALVTLFSVGSVKSMMQDEFIDAIKKGDQQTVLSIFDQQAKQDFLDDVYGVEHEDRQKLIEINRYDKNNKTPLIVSLEKKQFNIARMLVDYGADVNLEDINGITPFLLMAKLNHVEALTFLNDLNVIDINKRDLLGNTALILACQKKRYKAAKFLVKIGANINLQNIDGNTALIVATKLNDVYLVNILTNRTHEIKPLLENNKHENAFQLAIVGENPDIITMVAFVTAIACCLKSNFATGVYLFEFTLAKCPSKIKPFNYIYSKSCLYLAEMYLRGIDVKKDLTKGFEYLKLVDTGVRKSILDKYNDLLNYYNECIKTESTKAESKEKKESKEIEVKKQREIIITQHGFGKYVCECGHVIYGGTLQVADHRDAHDSEISGNFKCSLCVIPTYYLTAEELEAHNLAVHQPKPENKPKFMRRLF